MVVPPLIWETWIEFLTPSGGLAHAELSEVFGQ